MHDSYDDSTPRCEICDGPLDDIEPDLEGTGVCSDDCLQELRDLEYEARCEDAAYLREEGFDIDFADPGGVSALRAAGPGNPRNLPCPNCGAPDRLTPADRARGYQCDACAMSLERGW